MKFTKFDEYIANQLFVARVPKRITQEQFADMLSKKYKELSGKQVSRTAYASYEQGKRSMPIDIFKIACEILGLDWRQIFNEALENCKEEI